jgi:hypothetical protein
MNFEITPSFISDYINNFPLFIDGNIEYNNDLKDPNKVEIMLNIDNIDKKIFEKYEGNIIDRVDYYERIKVSSLISDDLFENENFFGIIYSILHFELYKNLLYEQSINFIQNHKDVSLNEYVLRKKFMKKLMYNQFICKKNVYNVYNNLLLNYDVNSEFVKDIRNLIKENGNVLNL